MTYFHYTKFCLHNSFDNHVYVSWSYLGIETALWWEIQGKKKKRLIESDSCFHWKSILLHTASELLMMWTFIWVVGENESSFGSKLIMGKLSRKFLSLYLVHFVHLCIFSSGSLQDPWGEQDFTAWGLWWLDIRASLGQHFSLHHPQLLSCEWWTISLPSQRGLFLPATLNCFPQVL